MHDEINLDAIKAEIKSEQAFQLRLNYGILVLVVLLVLGLAIHFCHASFPTSVTNISEDPDAAIATLQILVSSLMAYAIIGLLILGIHYYWLNFHIALRINRYSPSYVAHITLASVLSSFLRLFPNSARSQYERSILSSYEGGLARIEEELGKRPDNVDLLNVKAIRLLEAGQLEEAERLFRDILGRKSHWRIPKVVLFLNALGVCLMLQGRYEEAFNTLEAAIHARPLFGYSYDNLASYYLEQNRRPELALELAELALANIDEEGIDRLAVHKVTSARANALLGDTAKAELLLNNVQQSMGKINLRPVEAAEIHRQMGYTYVALGNHEAARTHFTRAVELDPNGLYGKLAHQGLQSIPT